MKKLLFITSVLLLVPLILIGCANSTPASTSAPAETTSTSTPSQTPQSGGTLRVLWQTGVSDLSLVSKQSLVDETMAKSYAETLVYYAADGTFQPELAKSWDIDTTAKTLTFHLQQGVKFQDGTDFDAQAVMWNVQNLIDSKRLDNGNYVDSISAPDKYTFVYHLNTMMTPSMMLHSYGYDLLTMFSPTAYETAGGTIPSGSDDQKSQEWATSHFVSTGPFKFESWTQDVSLNVVKNDNYWRGSQYPYLDGIDFIFVADPATAEAKMEAGEADLWASPALKQAVDLKNNGFELNIGVGGFYDDIIPNDKDASSPFTDQRVREALGYGIDRNALAAGLGYGILKPVFQCGGNPPSAGYNPNFQERQYNVQTAKSLLAQAGYPNGFETTMMIMTSSAQNLATAIQSDLAQIGIKVDIDVADPGRFINSLYQTGWPGLLLFSCPVDPEFAIGWFVHFGPQPIFPYPSLVWPDQYKTLLQDVANAPTVDQMRAATQNLMTFVSEGAYIIPLMTEDNMNVCTSKVHTQMDKEHFMTWHNYLDWIEH